MQPPSEPSPNPDFISRQVAESDYFFLDLLPSPESRFTVTCGGLEYCTTDYSIDRSQFEYHGIEYIFSGSCSLTLEGRTHELKAGSIFHYGPITQHQLRNTGSGPLVKFFVDFTGTEVDQVIGDPFLLAPGPYQMPNLKSMHALFEQLLEIGKQGGRGCQRILLQQLHLIALLTRFKAVDLDVSGTRSYNTYARCLLYIERHYASLHSVEQLAEICHVSTGHLSRVFKKFTDESPWQMIIRMKMNRAGELLLRSPLMVKDLAYRVGFEDAYHFSRVFKQFYGMAPKHFRETMRGPQG